MSSLLALVLFAAGTAGIVFSAYDSPNNAAAKSIPTREDNSPEHAGRVSDTEPLEFRIDDADRASNVSCPTGLPDEPIPNDRHVEYNAGSTALERHRAYEPEPEPEPEPQPEPEPEPEPQPSSVEQSGLTCNGYVRQPPAVLEWLKDHQNREGYWSSSLFGDDTTRTTATRTGNLDNWCYYPDYGTTSGELRCTSMALLTYVGAGYDHKEGDYRATCRQALLWMRKHQLADGSFDNANDLRDTALAAQALCDCYGLSGDMIVKKLADKAVAHLLSRRTPGSGWGLQSTSRPDAISTGYAILVVKTALVAGLEFDYQETLRDAAKFMEGLVPEDPDADIRYSADYESPPGVSGRAPVASACWVFVMLFSGKYEPNNKTLKRRADRLIDADCLPAWEAGRVDFEYWWMASLALYQVGGSRWKAWQKPLSTSLLRNQRGYREVEKGLTKADIDEHGSWDSVDKWNSGCGRVECTALAALSMEIYYRYLRLEGTSESD